MSRPCDRAARAHLDGLPVGYPDVTATHCDLCNGRVPLDADAEVTAYCCQSGELAQWTVRLFCPDCEVTTVERGTKGVWEYVAHCEVALSVAGRRVQAVLAAPEIVDRSLPGEGVLP